MPCKDTTSKAVVILDSKETLLEFDFSKLTCGKEIGGDKGFREFCLGQSIDKILKIEYEDMAEKMGIEKEDDRFLLYLEWSALQSALSQYKGLEIGGHYKIAAIEYEEGRVEIRLVVHPPTEMPKSIMSCAAKIKTQDS